MALSNPFTPAKRQNKRVKLLIYGEPGAGKTTLALQLQSIVGGKVAMIDTEGGADLYADAAGMPAFDVLRTKTYADIKKALEFIQFGKHDYTLLIVDPITVIWTVIIEGVVMLRENALINKGGNPDSVSLSFKDWGVIKRKMNTIYNLLVNLPIHVIVTAREKEEFEGEGDSRKKVGSKPDAEKSLDYLFDAILHLNRDTKGVRYALVKKDRSGQLQPRLEAVTPATLAPLFANQGSSPDGYHLPSEHDAAAALATELEHEEQERQPVTTQPGEPPQPPANGGSSPIRRGVEARKPSTTPDELFAHLRQLAEKTTVDDGLVSDGRRNHMFGEWNKYIKDDNLLGVICKDAFQVASRADMSNKQVEAVLKWLAMNKDQVVNKEIDMMAKAAAAK
jgi:hypothetical protein